MCRNANRMARLFNSVGVSLSVDLKPGEGGGHSLIWPIRGRATGQGMVFGLICPKQGIQFYTNLS